MGLLELEVTNIIFNKSHLPQVLAEYIAWYNRGRVHHGIQGIPTPDPEIANRIVHGHRLNKQNSLLPLDNKHRPLVYQCPLVSLLYLEFFTHHCMIEQLKLLSGGISHAQFYLLSILRVSACRRAAGVVH